MAHNKDVAREQMDEEIENPDEQVRQRRAFPMPAFINFSALLILFTTIFLLNHFGPRWQGAKAPNPAGEPTPQATAEQPAEPPQAAAEKPAETPQAAAEQPAETPEAAAEKPAEARQAAAEKPMEASPIAEAPTPQVATTEAPTQAADAQPRVTATTEAPSVVERTKPAAQAAAPAQAPPVAAMSVQTLPAVIKPTAEPVAVVAAPPKAIAVAPAPPPVTTVVAEEPAKKEAKKPPRDRWNTPDAKPKTRNMESVLEATVEHLDSEAARQSYLASGSAGKQDSGKKASDTAPSGTTQAAPASTSNNNYFIPFEKKR